HPVRPTGVWRKGRRVRSSGRSRPSPRAVVSWSCLLLRSRCGLDANQLTVPAEHGVEAGLAGDVLDVAGHAASLLRVTEGHRACGLVDPTGHETRRDPAVVLGPDDRDRGVATLRMEGVGRHGRI